jgi:hypothetical protein
VFRNVPRLTRGLSADRNKNHGLAKDDIVSDRKMTGEGELGALGVELADDEQDGHGVTSTCLL